MLIGKPGPPPERLLLDRLRDQRGRRVVLVSHCLLNQNTRYAGGATRAGAVAELADELIGAGYGIHQLPCPERLAWGGVLKRHSLRLYHSKVGHSIRCGLCCYVHSFGGPASCIGVWRGSSSAM